MDLARILRLAAISLLAAPVLSQTPAAKPSLTFEVVYKYALRTYYLLYPAMNQIFPLNSESAVASGAALSRDA